MNTGDPQLRHPGCQSNSHWRPTPVRGPVQFLLHRLTTSASACRLHTIRQTEDPHRVLCSVFRDGDEGWAKEHDLVVGMGNDDQNVVSTQRRRSGRLSQCHHPSVSRRIHCHTESTMTREMRPQWGSRATDTSALIAMSSRASKFFDESDPLIR